MKSRKEEILEKLNKLSEGKVSDWEKKAEWRERNDWWLTPKAHIHLFWLRFLRKIGLRKKKK